jgi:hypothetical protein
VCSLLRIAPATVTAISPTFGPSSGSTVVTLTGTEFLAGSTCTFGGVPGLGVTVSASTRIRCLTPAGLSSRVSLEVTRNGEPNSGSISGFVYEFGTFPPDH